MRANISILWWMFKCLIVNWYLINVVKDKRCPKGNARGIWIQMKQHIKGW